MTTRRLLVGILTSGCAGLPFATERAREPAGLRVWPPVGKDR